MKTSTAIFGLVCAAFLALVPEVAMAQATRTWVSGVGDDVNPCSRTAPCKTFQGAISKTATGGEINVLDPGGFGAVTITKSITISSEGFEAGVLVSGTNGIIVNVASTDKVVLRGLDIVGVGTGLVGVLFNGAGQLHIEKCTIRGFGGGSAFGVQFASNGAPSKLFIVDTIISENGAGATGGGINIAPAAGGNANVTINRTQVSNNAAGVVVNGSNSTAIANLTINQSEIVGNTNTGVLAISSGSGSPAKVMINNSVLMANAPAALTANGTGQVPGTGSAVIRIGNSVITSNPLAQSVVGQGQVLSYKNNLVDGNANDATPIPQVNLN
jgi:hypothetical protein